MRNEIEVIMYTKAIRKIYEGKNGDSFLEVAEKAESEGFKACEFKRVIFTMNMAGMWSVSPFDLSDFEVK